MYDFVMDDCKRCAHYDVCGEKRKDDFAYMCKKAANIDTDGKAYDVTVNITCNQYQPYRHYTPYYMNYSNYSSRKDYRR